MSYFASTPVIASIESAPEKEFYTPLSAQEKVRLGQLVRIVERGLSQFLAVGAALLEIRELDPSDKPCVWADGTGCGQSGSRNSQCDRVGGDR